ncbi:MAG: OmpA family protein [Aureispira sp.]|nr:OmpA family protein [Aureispira sp.]
MKQYKIVLLVLGVLMIKACTYPERIKDGKTAYERKQYAVAIEMLEKEFNKAKEAREKGQSAYMLADSYTKTNQPQAASDWYKKAQQYRFGMDTDLKYARSLQQLEQYDEASQAYQSAGRYAGDVKMYREQMIACKKAKQWKKNADKSDYSVSSLDFNNKATDFSPTIYEKGKLLISSDRAESEGKEDYKWTNKKFFDLYIADTEGNNVERFDVPFNTTYHQGAIAFNGDKTMAFFTQCGSDNKEGTDYCKLMMCKKEGDKWSKPEHISFNDEEYNYMHPQVNKEGNILYFSTDNKAGFGGYDLYYSLWIETEKRWDTPRNMGSKVNTKGNEVFPTLDADTLYFSSDGHPGMGGLDLFRIDRFHDRWKNLQNLQAPINSGGDDFGLVVDELSDKPAGTLQIGYFASNRLDSKGSDDIYKFERKISEPELIVVDTPQIVFRLNLDGIVKEKILKNPSNPNSEISGYKELMGASVQIVSEDTAFTIGSDVDGTFSCELKVGMEYNLKATKPGYFAQTATVSTKEVVLTEENPEQTLTVELIMDRIIANQEIVLENIYYDYDKFFIRDDAKPTLDSLIGILQRNPSIRIQLSSHTDCRGANGYNEKLSQQRAEAAVQYLIANGVIDERLEAKGYGENKPAIACKCTDCTEDQHQGNRRTTFMVLE